MGKRPVAFSDQDSHPYGNRSLDLDGMELEPPSEVHRAKLDLLNPESKQKKKQTYANDAVSKKILLLQDILYEVPEIETNLMNSIDGSKHKDRKSLSAKIFRFVFGLIFILLMYSSIFVMGLIVSSYLLSPIPLTGSIMRNYLDQNLPEELQKIVIVPQSPETGPLKIRGTFRVSYNVYNNTPFSGALSTYMNVSYLPQSGSKANNDKCFGAHAYNHIYRYKYSNVREGELNFFRKPDYSYEDTWSREDVIKKKKFGSLIALEKVLNEKEMVDKTMSVLDTKAYNAFVTQPLVGNKIQIIPKIARGINKVVLLVTLEREDDFTRNTEGQSQMLRRMLHDCEKNGFLTLKFEASLQTFDTMLFSGNMLPTNFFPVAVPCMVSSDEKILEELTRIAKNQRDLYNRQQYILKKLNTALNM